MGWKQIEVISYNFNAFTQNGDGSLTFHFNGVGITIPPGTWFTRPVYEWVNDGTETVRKPKKERPKFIRCEYCELRITAGSTHRKRFCSQSCYHKWWIRNGRKGAKPRKRASVQ